MVGGDITEITFDNPDVGRGRLYPKAAEDSTFDTGGFRTVDDDNNVDSGGNAIDIINRKRWSFECTLAWDANDREDLEKLVELAGSTKPTTWTISCINDVVYKGEGRPVGDLQGAGNAATIGLKVSGGGTLEKISG